MVYEQRLGGVLTVLTTIVSAAGEVTGSLIDQENAALAQGDVEAAVLRSRAEQATLGLYSGELSSTQAAIDRQRKQKQFITVGTAVAVVAVVGFGVYLFSRSS